ncbi:transcription cofactor vestigial-like protein 2 isoform X3 [Limulus polyphemus]|uniref:Transcription cofactor vestigial-like protein 2 isoform X3 n=1 Tax=Limulus polyphemus TaxID=6850 RepID=A0ABM1TLV7_LIMPO|nr:transcription cofactor vestigial-like protein 2 isoform X3 [Limulus polyphemus]
METGVHHESRPLGVNLGYIDQVGSRVKVKKKTVGENFASADSVCTMSCIDVMYQPYTPYFPYPQRPAPAAAAGAAPTPGPTTPMLGAGPFAMTGPAPPPAHPMAEQKKFLQHKMLEPIEHPSSDYHRNRGIDCSTHSPVVSVTCTTTAKDDDKTVEDLPQSAADAHYISANCVLLTYFNGDTSAAVDEHFSRALSQPSSYGPDSGLKTLALKDGPPMSQRNFPPSFWNSNYQPPHPIPAPATMTPANHHEFSYATDPYHSGALHPGIHQNDPWHYTLSSHAQAANPYSHRPMHELAYSGMSSVPTGNMFNQYGSLLLQPSMRSSRLTHGSTPCASLDKPTDTWGTPRYHEPLTHNLGHMESNYSATYGTMGTMPGVFRF